MRRIHSLGIEPTSTPKAKRRPSRSEMTASVTACTLHSAWVGAWASADTHCHPLVADHVSKPSGPPREPHAALTQCLPMTAQDLVTRPAIRILLLADTHLGFDLPFHSRVERRRRGHDFFANTARALEPALRGEVDLVVHGGDLFYRTRVPPALVELALAPLLRVAEAGCPSFSSRATTALAHPSTPVGRPPQPARL